MSLLTLLHPSQAAGAPSALGGETILALHAGTITGIVVRSNEARTAGTLTAYPVVNGAVQTGLSAVLDGTNTTYKVTTGGSVAYVAGDALGVAIVTDGTWAPTTADIRTMLELTET